MFSLDTHYMIGGLNIIKLVEIESIQMTFWGSKLFNNQSPDTVSLLVLNTFKYYLISK